MIKIFQSHKQFFIWNAEDARSLRETHRIVGALIGCLARNPLQNGYLGLPILLMNCEARLLVEYGLACIINENNFGKEDIIEEKIKQKREMLHQEQIILCKKEKRKEMEQNMGMVVEGKKRKICGFSRHNNMLENISGSVMEISDLLVGELEQEERKIEQFVLPLESSVIQIHTARFPEEFIEEVPSSSWCLQSSKEESLKYNVFCHFWKQGYFLTCGTKFGGDFLVYPGDPSRFHSFYIVVCVDSNNEINIMKLVRMSRLGNSVKKTFVIASVDSDDSTVKCWSLQRTED